MSVDQVHQLLANSTALHLAATGGHMDLVKYLVGQAGADLEAREGVAGWTPSPAGGHLHAWNKS